MFGSKDHLSVKDGRLQISGADACALAEEFGTPLYVTSEERLIKNIRSYHMAFPDADKYFAVKANGNLAILRVLAREGAGADVFSAGELSLAVRARVPKDMILLNGNSKRPAEHMAALEAGVRISIDSVEELECLSALARSVDKTAQVLFRINPDVSPKTHPKIATGLRTSKFGIPAAQVPAAYRRAMDLPGVEPVGLHCHIGSQILDISPFMEAVSRMMDVAADVVDCGGDIKFVDIGGGLGIQYMPDSVAPTPDALAAGVRPIFNDHCQELSISPKMVLEPGRSIVADTSVLLTRVNVVKRAHVTFAGVDAGFNTLARPMLYDSYHHIVAAGKAASPLEETYTVVGPICESGDVLAKDRRLARLEGGDILAFLDTGAYGFSMASQYNGQPRPAEVLIHEGMAELTRRAEDASDLMIGQQLPPRLM